MNIAGQCLEKIQEHFSYHCPYLFVDEAHHIAATTWKQFKDRFMSQEYYNSPPHHLEMTINLLMGK